MKSHHYDQLLVPIPYKSSLLPLEAASPRPHMRSGPSWHLQHFLQFFSHWVLSFFGRFRFIAAVLDQQSSHYNRICTIHGVFSSVSISLHLVFSLLFLFVSEARFGHRFIFSSRSSLSPSFSQHRRSGPFLLQSPSQHNSGGWDVIISSIRLQYRSLDVLACSGGFVDAFDSSSHFFLSHGPFQMITFTNGGAMCDGAFFNDVRMTP